jgi:thiamine biosynthesis protein ThiI
MKFVLKLFPEIVIKSRPVRKRLTTQLTKNLRKLLKPLDKGVRVESSWDAVEVICSSEVIEDINLQLQVIEKLKNTQGIDWILQVVTYHFKELSEVIDIAVKSYADSLAGKTFCVRVKRTGRHAFNSIDAERQIGGALLHHSQAAGVKLKNPDVIVNLEIKQEEVYIISERIRGLGGFPMGQQDSCLSLISGGYDSSVASYLMMKRGIRTHFCFFNLGGMAHEVGVKQVAHHLWDKYSSTHRVLFISIPFEPVVSEILKTIHHSQMGVVLKRMMLRVGEKVANEFDIPAMVTGQAVGQVSSQTMVNLSVIDLATSHLTLRPLITMDKQSIIELARETGTEAFSAVMPEYCGVISDKPTTRAKLGRIEAEEANFNFELLEQAFENRKVEGIDKIYQSKQNLQEVEVVSLPQASDIVIDIRHPDEAALQPLFLTKNKVMTIPFFKLQNSAELSKGNDYLLYCDKGVMSQLQAEDLIAKGYQVKVYQP